MLVGVIVASLVGVGVAARTFMVGGGAVVTVLGVCGAVAAGLGGCAAGLGGCADGAVDVGVLGVGTAAVVAFVGGWVPGMVGFCLCLGAVVSVWVIVRARLGDGVRVPGLLSLGSVVGLFRLLSVRSVFFSVLS